MMIKEKSNPWARLKYLYILPVAAICMIACTQSAKSTASDYITYEAVEEKPEYPGGMGELSKLLSSNLLYPLISFENGVQGEVLVQFVIDKEGNIVVPNAASPDQPEKLIEQLKEVLAK